MRIVDRKTFLAMPAGTVYSKFSPDVFDALEIKGETTESGDFLSQQIADAIQSFSSEHFSSQCDAMVLEGARVEMDFSSEYRDGLRDQGQLFAVWSTLDVAALIKRLQLAIAQVGGRE